MIPVKIHCGCGQRYAFEVEPVNGLMPSSVACPVCGADGTGAANEIIAHVLAAQSTASCVVPTNCGALPRRRYARVHGPNACAKANRGFS